MKNQVDKKHARIRFANYGVFISLALLLALVLLTLAACGNPAGVGDGGSITTVSAGSTTTGTEPSVTSSTESQSTETTRSTVTTASTTTTTGISSDTMTISVYFSRDEKMAAAHRVIPKTQSVGLAAVQALLEGPTAQEKAAGMSSVIPAGTRYLGLNIKDGTATVDLSKEYESGGGSLSMALRLAQVVYTLTQFPSVDNVEFQLDGSPVSVFGGEGIILNHPVGRADYEELTPAILVESPTVGDTISSPIRVTGTANVFEAVLSVKLVAADGTVIVPDSTVHATSGTGTRGMFDVTLPFVKSKTGQVTLTAFSSSPKDGSSINVVKIPVLLKP